MKTYSTSQIAKEIGVHPNTIRFYEEVKFLQQIPRKSNRYRIYNQIHLEQLRLIRIGLKSELLQNGLRKQVIEIIKTSANEDYEKAIELSDLYLKNLIKEQKNAEEAISIVENKLLNEVETNHTFTRKQAADYLETTIDTLRNWELNGLLRVKRKENGYRIYDEKDIKVLKIISSLRCANFSLSSILRLLQDLETNQCVDIRQSITIPKPDEDIISVCDKLLISLENAINDCKKMKKQIEKIQNINYPL